MSVQESKQEVLEEVAAEEVAANDAVVEEVAAEESKENAVEVVAAEESKENTVEEVAAEEKAEEKKPANPKKTNKLFVAFTASVSLLALAYVLNFVFTAIGGMGVAVSTMIGSTVGYILAAVALLPLAVFTVIAAVNAWKLVRGNTDSLPISVKKLGFAPNVLSLYALFAFIESMVLGLYAILKGSVLDNAYNAIADVLNFQGYESLWFFDSLANPVDASPFFQLMAAIGYALVGMAYALGMVYLFSRIKSYYITVVNVSAGGQYEIEQNPPVILLFIFAVLNVVLGVFAILAGAWVDAIVNIAVAAYFVASSILFKNIHARLYVPIVYN